MMSLTLLPQFVCPCLHLPAVLDTHRGIVLYNDTWWLNLRSLMYPPCLFHAGLGSDDSGGGQCAE